MPARAARALLVALAALTMLAILGALVAPDGAVAQRPGVRVYVLEGGHRPSDLEVAQALRDRGFIVTRGAQTSSFDGTQATLSDYDVVVVLYTANWSLPVPQGGLDAIRAYVLGGGSLVTGEWFGWRGQLADLMPSTNCSWNTAPATTYTQAAPNALINAGLPISFTFPLADFSGSETCLEARPEATVLYSSSNGGGRGEHVGLAAWNVGEGRVIAFSTLLSATELQSTEYRTLFQNVVAWSADVRDVSPPRLQQVDLASAGGLLRGRDVQLSIRAQDRGASGVGAVIVAEYVYSGDPNNAWRLVSTSGWIPYRQRGLDLSLTLSDTPGVHYLRVHAADRAGNISRDPAVVFVNYNGAAPTPLGLDELHIYRLAPGPIPLASVRMSASAGNPDLYVFGPGVAFAPETDAPIEQLGFAPQLGVYQVEVSGFEAGAYTLEYNAGPLQGLVPGGGPSIERRGRGSVINLSPPEPTGGPGDIPAPPVTVGELPLEPMVYLPSVQGP